MRFANSLTKFVLCFCQFYGLSVACASTTKEQVKVEIQNQFAQSLNDTQWSSAEEKAQANRNLSRFVNTVNDLKIEKINDALSDWIVESYLFFVQQRPSILLNNDPQDKYLLDDAIFKIRHRFKNLTNEKGEDLLRVRKSFDPDNKAYRRQVISHLSEKLAESTTFRINLGRTAMPEAGNAGFAGIVGSLTVVIASPDPVGSRSSVDYSADAIKSKILTLAFINEILTRFNFIDAAARFTEESLFSPMYDADYVNSILQWKTFAQVKSDFDKMLSSVISHNQNVTTIHLDPLLKVIGDALSLRWKKASHQYKTSDLSAYISFLNNRTEWNAVKNP